MDSDRSRPRRIFISVGTALLICVGMTFTYAYYFSGLRVESSKYQIDWRLHPVIVFESDDWGATRLFNNAETLDNNIIFLNSMWSKRYKDYIHATLESPADLKKLFAVLNKHRGADQLPAVFTANYVMCSPDYEKIKEDQYNRFYNLCLPAVPKSWERGDFLSTAREGIQAGVWVPEYHGMLHANPNIFMERLNSFDNTTRQLFDTESYAGMNGENCPEYDPKVSIDQQRAMIKEGIGIFIKVFGTAPTSSVSPFYVWQQRTEEILASQRVRVIQGKNVHTMRGEALIDKLMGKVLNISGYRSSNRGWQIRMGDRNVKTGLTYLLRNVKFEPMVLKESENIDDIVGTILQLLAANQPVVVSTHRFNYVSLDPRKNVYIRLLDDLLRKIERVRPDVVYLTDSELAQLFELGYSVRTFGNMIVIRNFSDEQKTVHVDVPVGMKAIEVSMIPQTRILPLESFDINKLSIPRDTNVIVRFKSGQP